MNKPKEPCQMCGEMCYDWRKEALGLKSSWCNKCQEEIGKQITERIEKALPEFIKRIKKEIDPHHNDK